MKRISRGRYLTQEEAAKYDAVRRRWKRKNPKSTHAFWHEWQNIRHSAVREFVRWSSDSWNSIG